MKNCKQAILFDLDGTLWDSSENVMRSWNEALGLLGVERSFDAQAMRSLMGLPMDEIFQALLPDIQGEDRKKAEDFCEQYENEYVERHGGNLYPDVEEVLSRLHERYFIAIVSNCQKGYIEAFLRHYGFEKYIDDLESFGGTGQGKAENIRLVMERNQLESGWYVGDIYKDYAASTEAGIPFILAAYGFGPFAYSPSISCLKDLESVISS